MPPKEETSGRPARKRKSGVRKGQVPSNLQRSGGSRKDAYDVLAYQAGGKPYEGSIGTSRRDAFRVQEQQSRPGGMGFNRAPQTTIEGKPGKNRSGGTNMRTERQTTIDKKKDKKKSSSRGGRAPVGEAYDPYAGLPQPTGLTAGDVQSESLSILDNLVQGMLFNEGPSYDYESAMQEAAQGIRQAYKADIQAIRGQIKGKRRDTKKARREVEQMYAGLAQAYGQDANKAAAAGDASVAEVGNIAKTASDDLGSNISKMLQEQAALAKGLGMEEALTDPSVADTDVEQQALSRIAQQGASAQTLASQTSDANEQWFRRGAQGAQMEGTDKSADLLSQFLDFKTNARSQIGQLKGQRARDVAESNASIEQQAAELQAQADAETWKRLMEYMGMRSDIEDTNFDNALGANKFQWNQVKDRENIALDRSKHNESIRENDRRFQLDVGKARTDRFQARTGRINALQGGQDGGEDSLENLPSVVAEPMKVIQSSGLPPQSQQKVLKILRGLQSSGTWIVGEHRMNKQNIKLNPNLAAQLATQAGRKGGLTGAEIRVLAMAAMQSF